MANRLLTAVPLLLVFTGVDVLWADSPHPEIVDVDGHLVDELTHTPQPGTRTGPALRLGTHVGYTAFGSERVDSLGGYVNAAWQVSRFALEAEFGYFRMHERVDTDTYSGNQEIGRFHRVGLSGRFDIAELGGAWVGDATKLVLWLEGGIGRQAGFFHTGETFSRTDMTGGFGWLLDHRLKKPLGFPSRVGWHFGWRLTRTGIPTLSSRNVVCKAPVCRYRSEQEDDIGLLVSSGIHFSW